MLVLPLSLETKDGVTPVRQANAPTLLSGPKVGLFIGNQRVIGIKFCGGSVGSSGNQIQVAACHCDTTSHTKKVSFPDELDPVKKRVVLLFPNIAVIRTDKWWRAVSMSPIIDTLIVKQLNWCGCGCGKSC